MNAIISFLLFIYICKVIFWQSFVNFTYQVLMFLMKYFGVFSGFGRYIYFIRNATFNLCHSLFDIPGPEVIKHFSCSADLDVFIKNFCFQLLEGIFILSELQHLTYAILCLIYLAPRL